MAVCSFCGASTEPEPEASGGASAAAAVDDEPLPLTWVTSYENGRHRIYCDRCSREHLRSIESKLDSEWW